MIRRATALLSVIAIILGIGWLNNSHNSPTTAKTPGKQIPNLDLDIAGWLPWWDDGSGLSTFKSASSTFSEIHPFSYEATSATEIKLQGTVAHAEAVAAATRKAKAAVVPTLTETLNTADFTALLNDPQARATHATAVCNWATTNSFDGVDIDYESFVLSPAPADAPRLAPAFTDLMKQMADCLHSHKKKLEVTVLPRTGDPRYAYFESHLSVTAFDYQGLGQVVDFIQPMAYDYSYPGSAPGSVDPIEWVKAVVKFTTDRVPPAKVQLGIALYGYDWLTKGKAITAGAATKLAQANNVIPTRDAASESLVFTYTVDGNNRTVWYDDAKATAMRVDVARQAGLNGVSFWALGDQEPGTWASIIAPPKP